MIQAFDRFWGLFTDPQWARGTMAGWLLVGAGALALLLSQRPATRGPNRLLWIALALLGPALCLEMIGHSRFKWMNAFRSLVREKAGAEAVAGRRPWQAALVVVALLLSTLAIAFIARSTRFWSGATRLAAIGLGVALTGFLLEVISLHQIDAHYGIYWSLWFGGIALMLSAILWAARSSATAPPFHPIPRIEEELGHRSYRIGSADSTLRAGRPDDSREPLRVILLRLAWLIPLLCLPEALAWLSF